MTLDPSAAAAAVDAVLADAGLGAMTVDAEHRPDGRRPAAAGLRLFGRLAGGVPVTAKILPAAWPFDLDEALRIQRRYASGALPAFAAPDLLAQGRVDGWRIIVEQQVVGGRSLADLVVAGEIATPDAAAILAQAVRAAQSLPVAGAGPRCLRERAEVFAVLDRAPIPVRHRARIAHWLSANYDLVSHQPVDSHGDYSPSNLLRVPGDDRWWLVDFDLAATTSLLWHDHLRIARLTGWTLPAWDDAWGHPDSLAIAFLSRLLEWDLQVAVTADNQGAGEHAMALGIAAERWADLLGPPARQAPSPRSPLPDAGSAGVQVFWPVDGQYSEASSTRGHWPADGDRRLIEIEAPAPVAGRIRFDPAGGPCAISVHGIEVRDSAGIWRAIPSSAISAGPDLLLLDAGELGCWCLCQGVDPQLLIDPPVGEPVAAIRIDGAKRPGLDPVLADALVSVTGIDPACCAALIRIDAAREQQVLAELRADVAELQWRLGAVPAAVESAPKPGMAGLDAALASIAKLQDRIDHQEADLLAALTAARLAGERWAARVVELQAGERCRRDAGQAAAEERLLRQSAEAAAQTARVAQAAAETQAQALQGRLLEIQGHQAAQEARLAELLRQHAVVTVELTTASADRDRCHRQVAEASETIQALRVQVAKAQADLEGERRAREQSAAEAAAARSDDARRMHALETELRSAVAGRIDLEARQAEVLARMALDQERIHVLEAELRNASQAGEQAEIRLSELVARATMDQERVQALQVDLQTIRQMQLTAESKYADQQSINQQEAARRSSLEASLAAAEIRCNDWRQRSADLQRQEEHLHGQIERLLVELTEVRRLHHEADHASHLANERHQQVTSALQGARQECDQLQHRLIEMNQLKEELVDYRNRCSEYRAGMEAMQAEIIRLSGLHATLLDRIQAGEQARDALVRLRRHWMVRLIQRGS